MVFTKKQKEPVDETEEETTQPRVQLITNAQLIHLKLDEINAKLDEIYKRVHE